MQYVPRDRRCEIEIHKQFMSLTERQKEMKRDFEDIPNDKLSIEIDRWVKSERNRAILKRRLIDGLTFDELSAEFDLSRSRVIKICMAEEERLFGKIKG